MITITDNINVIQIDFGTYQQTENIQKCNIISIKSFGNDVFIKQISNEIIVINYNDVDSPVVFTADALAVLLVTYLNNYTNNWYIEKFTATEGQSEFIPQVTVKADSLVYLDGRKIEYTDDWTITAGKLEMVIPCTDLQILVIHSHA